MKYALPSIKIIAAVWGLVLGLCQSADQTTAAQIQWAQSITTPTLTLTAPISPTDPPALPVTPTTASSVVFMPVHGIACIDRDVSGVCGVDEARVPNVIIRNSDGMAVVSDNSGEFNIQAAPHSELDITLPTGYKSINGNLHRYRIQMADTRNNIDIALALDAAYLNPTGLQEGSGSGANANAAQTPSDSLSLTSNNALLRMIAVSVVILATLAVLIVLRTLQKAYQRSLSQQDTAQRDQQTKDIASRLEYPEGWQLVAGQVVADIMRKPVSIDESAGILNAVAEPSPRFSIVTLDRQEIMFTTNPDFLRKARLIRGKDRIIDITARSAISHTSIRMLWQHICATRNMLHVTPPEATHWHMLVRIADNRPEHKRQYTRAQRVIILKPRARPYKPWRGPA